MNAAAPAREAGGPGKLITVEQALAELSTPQRDVFLLVHGEQFTVKEAAKILAIQEGTAKSHLHRSLKRLRKILEVHHDA